MKLQSEQWPLAWIITLSIGTTAAWAYSQVQVTPSKSSKSIVLWKGTLADAWPPILAWLDTSPCIKQSERLLVFFCPPICMHICYATPGKLATTRCFKSRRMTFSWSSVEIDSALASSYKCKFKVRSSIRVKAKIYKAKFSCPTRQCILPIDVRTSRMSSYIVNYPPTELRLPFPTSIPGV